MATLRKRKNKRGGFDYYIDFYYSGHRFRKKTGTADLKTCKLIKKEIEAKIARGNFNIEDVKPKKTVFLDNFIKEFLPYSQSHKANSTFQMDKRVLQDFRRFTGNIAIDTIDKNILDHFLLERLKTLRRSSVNIDLRHLKAALSKAVEWNYIGQNPAKGIRPLVVPQAAPKFFTEVQLLNILQAVGNDSLREIIIFAANTGVRISELINIEWPDIDLGNMVVRISQKNDFQTKSKKDRVIALNEAAYGVIAGIERKGKYVFGKNDGSRREKNFLSRRFKKCLREINLGEGYSFHSLRHTFASHLAQKGVSLYIISRLLGHSDTRITEIYSHLTPDQFHTVVGSLNLGKSPQIDDSQKQEEKIIAFRPVL